MAANPKKIQKKAQKTVELFWQTVPPVWHAARSITHQTATEEFSMTVSQFHTLRRIADGNTSVSDLADCMHLNRSNISRSVDELVNSGLVDRKQDSRDRRNVNLTLTDHGKELIQIFLDSNGKKMVEKFSLLTDEDLDDIFRGLIALQKVFGKKESALGKR
jgi:DNA-binding MarR family transcriptional regulator